MRRSLVVLGVLGSLISCSSDPSPPQDRIVVTIEHSAFRPASLTVQEGSTVTFLIRNTDPIDHEFILGDELVQQIHEEGTEAQHGAKPGEVSIPAGEVRRTTYTFDEAGELIYGCHLPGHYDFGMKGVVKVL